MKVSSVRQIASAILVAGALALPGVARADQVDLSAYVNANVSGYTAGGDYPAPGAISIGGVAFSLSGFDGGTGVIQAPAGGASYSIGGFSIANAGTAYTIINSAFGAFGSSIGDITFVGSGGSMASFQLVEGLNVRDHYYGFYNNVATNLYATAAYQNGAVVPDGPGRAHFDVQKFSLSPLGGEALVQIVFTGNGSSGGLPFLAAVTTTQVAAAVPEPSTWAMMLLGLAGLGVAARRRTRAFSPSRA